MSLDQIRDRAANATEGPWEAMGFDDTPGDEGSCILAGTGMDERAIAYSIPYPWHPEDQTIADAEFIAAARTDIPRLLAAIDAVTALAKAWEADFPYKASQIRTAITAALEADQ